MSYREDWRPVVGFQEQYEVSSLGRVRSRDRQVQVLRAGRRYTQALRGRLRKPATDSRGYQQVVLGSVGIRHVAMVHRLVADAFLPARPTGHEVNHKDGNKRNNQAANLEWVTRGENLKHAYATGLRIPWQWKEARP